MSKKAFVTGITGQDGSYLAEFLLKKGYEVHAITRRSSVFTTDRINHLTEHLKKQNRKVNLIKFPDHHHYTLKDIEKILLIHRKDKSRKKLILTTEKDATKLRQFSVYFNQENIYYIPIDIIINKEERFEKQILDYVKSN